MITAHDIEWMKLLIHGIILIPIQWIYVSICVSKETQVKPVNDNSCSVINRPKHCRNIKTVFPVMGVPAIKMWWYYNENCYTVIIRRYLDWDGSQISINRGFKHVRQLQIDDFSRVISNLANCIIFQFVMQHNSRTSRRDTFSDHISLLMRWWKHTVYTWHSLQLSITPRLSWDTCLTNI